MPDDTLATARGIVGVLETFQPIVSRCGDRVYGESQPKEVEWPFIRYAPVFTGANGSEGSNLRVQVSVFGRGPSMDEASTIAKLVVKALDGKDVALPMDAGDTRSASTYELIWIGTTPQRDGAEDWHFVVEFSVATAGA